MLHHVVCHVTEKQTGASGHGVSGQQIHDMLQSVSLSVSLPLPSLCMIYTRCMIDWTLWNPVL